MDKFFDSFFCLYEKYKIAFLLIKRNGSTCIKNGALIYNGIFANKIEEIDGYLNENHLLIPYNKMKEFEKEHGVYTKIVVYRHPIDRIISNYEYFILDNNFNESYDYWRLYNKSFSDYLKYVNFQIISNNININDTIKKQCDFFNINDIDIIIDINDLNYYLRKNFNFEIPVKRGIHANKIHDMTEYDDSLIREIYKDDINLINNEKFWKNTEEDKNINTNNLVSFIMPLYNTEKYLPICLNSILNQTYKNWELIIVDDCSTDSSYEIALEYSKLDKRIKLFKNETNLGCGLNRRKAISLASGDWFTFIDSDDYIDTNFVEKMLTACISTKSEVCVCGNEQLNEYYEVLKTSTSPNSYIMSKYYSYLDYMTTDWVKQYNGNKMFSKRVIDSVVYCDLRFCEDSITTYKWLWNANQIVVIQDAMFHYVQHSDSNSNKNNSDLIKYLDTCKCVYDHWLFCKKENYTYMYQALKNFIHPYYIKLIYMLDSNADELNILKTIKNDMNLS